jgi:Zn-dependent M28 family amino/carboxypeptidase
MTRATTLLCAAFTTMAAFTATAAEQPVLREIAGAPDAAQLQTTVQTLVGFGTRHTLSDTKSPKRGIGAARRWAQSRFTEIGRDCGGCLTIVTPSQTVTGDRVPKPAEIVDVVAIQKGTTDPERVIVLTGHIDSRVTS